MSPIISSAITICSWIFATLFFLSKNQSENKAMSSHIEENLYSTFLSGLDNIDDVNLTINVMT